MTVDEISKLIKEQKNTENTALMFFGISGPDVTLTIIDIKTGDLLFTQHDQPRGAGWNINDPLVDKDMKSLLKQIRKRKD